MKKILGLILVVCMVLGLSACTQADRVSGAYVDNYHYEVNYLPEMIVPVTITMKD